ncbi:3'-5' exonuclease isoform X2 [Euphorbia lathyris]|uniref:3'-5' exonuclease isoform X2 n=1 Tax=Euphorbia lathyris TaxID=212925 RepID=UPI0033141622
MHTRQNYNTVSSPSPSSSSFSFPSISVPDLDQPLTDEDLQAIDAIEATFLQSTSTSSSGTMKRLPSPLNDIPLCKTRRQLPSSVLGGLSTPFSLSPCQANIKMKYPAFKFGGRILYSRTPAEVENAARELLHSFKSKRGETDPVIIGFDIEWRPTFKRGVLPGKAAVMQLCSGTGYCYVMHIVHSGIPESLQFLLEDSTLLKVGVGISGDSGKVFRDYRVSVKAVEDLSFLANKKFGGEPKSWGLQSLTEILVCKEAMGIEEVRFETKISISTFWKRTT